VESASSSSHQPSVRSNPGKAKSVDLESRPSSVQSPHSRDTRSPHFSGTPANAKQQLDFDLTRQESESCAIEDAHYSPTHSDDGENKILPALRFDHIAALSGRVVIPLSQLSQTNFTPTRQDHSDTPLRTGHNTAIPSVALDHGLDADQSDVEYF
jgi:hypothetical protein